MTTENERNRQVNQPPGFDLQLLVDWSEHDGEFTGDHGISFSRGVPGVSVGAPEKPFSLPYACGISDLVFAG